MAESLSKMSDQSSNNPTVTVKQGVLKGKIATSLLGVKYESYTGIPYAKPPLGNLRFKSPQPAEPWEGILDATKTANTFSQFDILFTEKYIGEEDGLYLNVYVPLGAKKPLPVMFWIHGGGFTMGTGSETFNGPDYFMAKEVILVTINYRLGPLGFLCLHTADVPGNAGLKDQVFALKWVSENISQFGGDPNSVTIFGESAGSASVDMMIASPTSKGLFHKAIAQSGSFSNTWAINDKPLDMAFLLGKILGHETQSVNDLYNFLLKVPAKDLAMACVAPEYVDKSIAPFVPVVEKAFPGEIAYLPEHPKIIVASGKHNIVPTVSGYNSNEGAFFEIISSRMKNMPAIKSDDEKLNMRLFIPPTVASKLSDDEMKNLEEEIKTEYFPSGNEMENISKIMGDTLFVKGIKDTNQLLTKHSNQVYGYVFAYQGNMNAGKCIFNGTYKGASHADDLGYMFRMKVGPWSEDLTIDKPDMNMVDVLTTLWTNFAKYGNPTPKITDKIPVAWSPMSKSATEYLLIDRELEMVQELNDKQLQLWDKYL